MKTGQREKLIQLIKEWRDRNSTLNEELLKTALRPLFGVEVELYRKSGLRQEDVEALIWAVIKETVARYDDPSVDPMDFISRGLVIVPDKVRELQTKISSLRTATPVPTKA